MNIDWDALRAAARTAAAAAYAPYSGLQVGAAGLVADGRTVTGCNVENASYGLTLCAECGMVSSLVAGGRARLLAVSVWSTAGALLTPCGRCRQVLLEHGGTQCLVDTGSGPRALGELLPEEFGPADLP
ncbi:cytidine deaminase [Sporichthya sp.]|uniref:cytidine deaminase n=1 Tax=Sporichthya sp. TaxID=65475 RepID=UPI00182BDAC2|nr:cytidine deaminase [Sporichthya sp.]